MILMFDIICNDWGELQHLLMHNCNQCCFFSITITVFVGRMISNCMSHHLIETPLLCRATDLVIVIVWDAQIMTGEIMNETGNGESGDGMVVVTEIAMVAGELYSLDRDQNFPYSSLILKYSPTVESGMNTEIFKPMSNDHPRCSPKWSVAHGWSLLRRSLLQT